jgi:hypothetical protein
MALSRVSAATAAVSFSVLALVGATAWSAEEINQQVLQGVGVFNSRTTLDMRFDGGRPPDFEVEVELTGSTSLVSCQRNGTRGLFCIYGKEVRRWAKPEEGGAGEPLFSCADLRLKLDSKRADPCTTLAVSQNGAVWVAGRRNSASVLIKVYEKDSEGLCELVSPESGNRDPALNGTYCFKEFPRLRPVLSKLVVVEGEEGDRFDRGTGAAQDGVLGLDIRDAVTFSSMNPSDAPIDLFTKSAWGLASRESLQDLTLLQTPSGDPDDWNNFLLLTTSTGRVLARQTDASPVPLTVNTVFDLAADAKSKGAQCPQLPASVPPHRYGIVASNKTGRVYATDRNHCRVLALEPDDDDDEMNGVRFTKLANVKDGDPSLPGTPDLTLSTVSGGAGTGDADYPPDGVTVAPGIAFDLADEDCLTEFDPDNPDVGGCTVISVLEDTTSGQPVVKPALRFASVKLNELGPLSGPLPSRVVVFKIENVPDCRYILHEDPTAEICAPYLDAVITPEDKVAEPGEQFLDIEEMLPQEVRDQFTGQRVLPDQLLISPSFRGRKDKGYFFGALFFIPEPDVVFKDTFDGEFDVAALLGYTAEADSRRCSPQDLPNPPSYHDLLQFDVITKTSERFLAPGGPDGGITNVDMMVNSGCGSTRIKGTTNSVYAYGLEPAYNPQGPNDDDGVYARLVAKLLRDLDVVQTQIACVADFDQDGSLPLSDCGSLNTSLRVTRDKFNKCLEATVTPQTSLLDRACNAFETQFLSYQAAVEDLPANERALDPANRIGELEARLTTIWLIYRERFLPSVPPEGFSDP